MAIKVPFVAEVSSFIKGTADMVRSLGNVSDSLDEVANTDVDVSGIEELGEAADAAGLKVTGLGEELDTLNRADTSGLESELKEIGAAGDAAAEKLEHSFKSAFDVLQAEGRTASRKTKADVKDVGDEGSRTMQEFSQEAKANVSETVSSFDGSASSAVDAIQGTFGGLVSALGPAGVVGVAAAGIGIGFAKSLFGKAQEEAEALREQVSSLFQEMAANKGVISDAFKADAIRDLIDDAEKLKDAFGTDDLDKINASFKELNLSAEDQRVIFAGLVGDATDMAAAQAVVNEEQAKWFEILNNPQASATQRADARQRIEFLSQIETQYRTQSGVIEDAASKQDLYSDSVRAGTEATDDSNESLKSKNETLRENADLTNEAVTSELDLLDALDGVTKAGKENGKSLNKNTEAGRDNLRAIDEARKGIIEYGDAMTDSGKSSAATTKEMDKQERVLISKVMRAFGLTEKEARSYVKTLGGIPPAKETKVHVDDKGSAKKTQERIDNIKSSGVPVPIEPDMSHFNSSVTKYLNGQKYYVTVYARTGKAAPT